MQMAREPLAESQQAPIVQRMPPSDIRIAGGDEQRTVERARNGDPHAFRVIVERYGAAVHALCCASTLRREDGEELAQEVFLSAWRSLARFRGDAAFSTWLFSIARNACVDHARRVAVRPQVAPEADLDQLVGSDAPREATATARAILVACRTLPVEKRQALLLRDLYGLAYDEIADAQGVPVGTVRSRISDARNHVASKVSR